MKAPMLLLDLYRKHKRHSVSLAEKQETINLALSEGHIIHWPIPVSSHNGTQCLISLIYTKKSLLPVLY